EVDHVELQFLDLTLDCFSLRESFVEIFVDDLDCLHKWIMGDADFLQLICIVLRGVPAHITALLFEENGKSCEWIEVTIGGEAGEEDLPSFKCVDGCRLQVKHGIFKIHFCKVDKV